MKRKVVLALIATLTLTVGSIGTVFAMNDSQGITIQISESGNHEHVWGAEEWVVDKEAVYEEQWVIDTPAWTETIEHPAEYEDQWIVDVPAYDQPVYENHTICYTCREQGLGNVIIDGQAGAHQIWHAEKGETCHYGTETIQVDTIHHEEVGHWEKVLIKDSWTETIEHPEEGHYEDVLVSPEEGHWEHTCTDCGEVQNSETGEVITPGNRLIQKCRPIRKNQPIRKSREQTIRPQKSRRHRIIHKMLTKTRNSRTTIRQRQQILQTRAKTLIQLQRQYQTRIKHHRQVTPQA